MEDRSTWVRRWDGEVPASEPLLREIMEAEGLRPYRWANSPGDVYGAHDHPYHKVVYVVEGSIVFAVPENEMKFALEPGDRLDLPAGVLHEAVVGPRGVVCLEGHR